MGVLSGGSGDYCGIPDLDELVQAYKTRDDVNFDFFARLEKVRNWQWIGGGGLNPALRGILRRGKRAGGCCAETFSGLPACPAACRYSIILSYAESLCAFQSGSNIDC